MGSFLSEPITEKVSTDELNDKLNCGASSMQGWRDTQEDAHNCLLSFDKNTALFAVYDGHGGHEVAEYCSQKLPDYIKNTEAYKQGNISKALVDAFLGFDALITTPEVVEQLKELVFEKKGDSRLHMSEDDSDEENLSNLYEEASMPIEKVIAKYANHLGNPLLENLKNQDGTLAKSPILKAKKDNVDVGAVASSSSTSSSEAKSLSSSTDVNSTSSSSDNDCVSSSCSETQAAAPVAKEEASSATQDSNGSSAPQIVITSSTPTKNEAEAADAPKNEAEVKEPAAINQNGESELQPNDVSSSSAPQENGDVSQRKGKALTKTKGVEPLVNESQVRERTRRNLQDTYYQKLMEAADREDSSEEDDDDDEDEDTSVNIENEHSDDSSMEGEDGEEDDDDEDDDDDAEEDLETMRDEPGSVSGCTAVVALLQENELYVANAGDSRCIVCRNGKAVEMSFDHKPEDEPERERITKAGGEVTCDGRVNGGLNLSRAIGDHEYKQNKSLSDREQMITALPDIKTLTINPSEDEFMVLACDGIWNFMSSQEVVDFVLPRIRQSQKLSQICEEMFDHCLAPNTLGDGTGCDNMTAIIVQFKPTLRKRNLSPTQNVSKRGKTDASESQIDTTA